jgi:hypothetical protein
MPTKLILPSLRGGNLVRKFIFEKEHNFLMIAGQVAEAD